MGRNNQPSGSISEKTIRPITRRAHLEKRRQEAERRNSVHYKLVRKIIFKVFQRVIESALEVEDFAET